MYPVLFTLPQWLPLLGGQPITSFGVMMLLAFLAAGYVTRAGMNRIGEDPEKAWDLVFMAVVGGILGAKTYYIFLNWPRLLQDPVHLIFARGGWYGTGASRWRPSWWSGRSGDRSSRSPRWRTWWRLRWPSPMPSGV